MIIKLDKEDVSQKSSLAKTDADCYKTFNFDKSYNFIEGTLSSYGFEEADEMFLAIVAYAEYALRRKNEGHDQEAGLLMGAALTMAHLFCFNMGGQYYLKEDIIKQTDLKGCIVHYAMRVADALFKDKHEEAEKLKNELDKCVSTYIAIKDCERNTKE